VGPKRIILLALGWLFLALGFLGVALPVLPTTPFLILALWAFSQSSRRMHDWLSGHRRFGPILREWREHRVIPLHAKLLAWTAMTASLAYAILVSRAPWPLIAAMASLMVIGATYVATKPSRRPARREEGKPGSSHGEPD
jgi:uncharacterized protein